MTATRRHFWFYRVCLLVWLVAPYGAPAYALDAIAINPNDDRVEVTASGELYDDQGDRLQVDTVAGRNGIAGRMSVEAQVAGTNPSWLVFALTNTTERRIERWLTADRYSVVGSGAVWPDLDAHRIEAVTPSIGFLPEEIKSDRADVYRITLEPGQTITYVAELSSERYARVYLWKPLAYELKVRERQLFNGVLLGLTGLLAIFITAIFAANHKAIFPTAALVAWCVLGYLCIEFGFFHKLFNLNVEDNAVYRAAGEAAIAASLVIFLYTFLRLGLAHSIIRMLFGVWMLAQLALVAVAVVDPRLAATFARMSYFLIGGVGAIATLYLAFRGQDRAISLIPTWILFLVWVFAAAVTLTGRLSGDVAVSGVIAGLVLVVVLIGFTVTQFAFKSLGPVHGASVGEQQLQALAVDAAGAATWEWSDRRNEVKVSPIVEAALGLQSGELSTKVDDFVNHIKPDDRDRFRLMLWSVQERGGGQMRLEFRLRASDNSYRWYELEAASVNTADRRSIRCVGLLRDISDEKRSQERLLHDAVHDNLTGLPNRELFVDRLMVAVQRANLEDGIRPTVLFVDIDKFKSVNDSLGLRVGDSLLLTVSRRLKRFLDPQDTLARISGDQFAILKLSEIGANDLAGLAERISRSLRSDINIAGRKVVLTGSIGIAVYDGEEASHLDLLREAEIAMYRAKRSGADRIEIFRPQMRSESDNRVTVETDLRTALDKNQIQVLFQPIVYLPTEELAGFEALVRWEHPTRGILNPDSFIPVAEETDLISRLGSYVLTRSVGVLSKWQKVLPRTDAPLYLSVNISGRQLMSVDFINELKRIMAKSSARPDTLRLEITESLLLSNPEQAVERMEQIRATGAQLALDDFGTGFSSLSYLQRFPVDTIKLDRSFVHECYNDDHAESAIVRSMVALSHELGKYVVAEGVEELRDATFLRSIGCEFAQGFYYGEPMTADDAFALLQIIRKSEAKYKSQGFFRSRPKKKDKKAAVAKPAAAPKPEKRKAPSPDKAAAKPAAKTPAGKGGRKPAVVPPPASPGATAPPATPIAASSIKVGTAGRDGPQVPPVPAGEAQRPAAAAPPPLPPSVAPQRAPVQVAATKSGAQAARIARPTNGADNASVADGGNGVPNGMEKAAASGRNDAAKPEGGDLDTLLGGLPPLPVDDAVTGPGEQPNRAPDVAYGETRVPAGGPQPEPAPFAGGQDFTDLSNLSPGIAASLSRLAGSTSGSSSSDAPRRLGEGGKVPQRTRRPIRNPKG